MKIEVERDALLSALKAVADVVQNRNTIPVLGNLLLVATGGSLQVTGTDLELQATSSVTAAGELSITVDKNKLVAAVSGKKPGKLEIEDVVGKVVIKQGRSRSTLMTLPSADFPKRKAVENGVTFSVASASLLRLLETTSPAMASDDVRFYLCGVFLHAAEGQLRAAASDGDRCLIRCQMPAPQGVENLPPAILPGKAIGHLRKLLGKAQAEVSVTISDSAAEFRFAGTEIRTAIVEGEYPNYQRVIPPEQDAPILCARDALIEPAGAVAGILNIEGDKLKFRKLVVEMKADQEHEISGQDSGGACAQEPFDAEYSGDPISFAINHEVARGVLGVFGESAKLSLSIADPGAPLLVMSDKDPDLAAVIMPMKV
ncbi:DNA polymerase III subunit beta [Sphingomonas koreensis]|nr:DNA polymerase III subunit beta [Sphingomonas koreensis]APR52008.1 DNA polymerase III subunit beta [Sphingomonas koreensis]